MSRRRFRRLPEGVALQCLDLYGEGYTLEEVGRRTTPRLSSSVVRGVLTRHAIRLRSASQAYDAKRAQHARWEAAYHAKPRQ